MTNEETETNENPIVDDDLLSLEKLDRLSPVLWPEQIPNINGFVAQNPPQVEPPSWTSDFTVQEVEQVYQLGSLPVVHLISEAKRCHDEAYKLSVEEAKEMTRGQFLNIFKRK